MLKLLSLVSIIVIMLSVKSDLLNAESRQSPRRDFNGPYRGAYLNRVAFPLGGIGAGMICIEGSGALSHVSVRNAPDIYNEPLAFAALCIRAENGHTNIAKILQGPIPDWKYFGRQWTGNGAYGTSYGLPRFRDGEFLARFPFATISLKDENIPFEVKIISWSPFIPGDADNSSLPVAALEYHFLNPTSKSIDAVFSFNAENFMTIPVPTGWTDDRETGDLIREFPNGFLLWQEGLEEKPHYQGAFAIFADDPHVTVNHCWFRGGWFDPLTVAWKDIQEGNLISTPPVEESSPGASLYVPFTLEPENEKTIRLMFSWFVPKSNLRVGRDPKSNDKNQRKSVGTCKYYSPWYAGQFNSIEEVASYWQNHYEELRRKSAQFRDAFYDTDLPAEVIEAVAANLTILKSPTVLRQPDGRLWCFEGCRDDRGCCSGSCTHVWNYAQAIPHLFPALERTLRETEFNVSQDERGHQTFRSALPIRPVAHNFHAAADGQLGGIMKVYREWRISGDTNWLGKIWPQVTKSLDYCIKTWDPKEHGVLEEPHHNTYDIEYWGPEGHCTSFYLGALAAAMKMGAVLGEDVTHYEMLLNRGKKYMEGELFNGEYFYQKVRWTGLVAENPVEAAREQKNLSAEAIELLEKEGPKYQYGTGCLSDGVLGLWLARMCFIDDAIIEPRKVDSHLYSVHKYNLRRHLFEHSNPQRPTFAMGKDGGLLLCTWPRGEMPTLPFVYSNEVWTGIEYQVASHLMLEGMVDEGLEIVRICRARYDGRVRNPFNEYECGHWYARAMSSYGLLQGLTGVRYDAVDKTLYINSQVGDNFRSFLSTETGFGTVGLKDGVPFVEMKMGNIEIVHVDVSGKKMKFEMNE